LAEALRETDWERFDVDLLKSSARRFSSDQFRRRFSSEVARILGQRAESRSSRGESVSGSATVSPPRTRSSTSTATL
jgi:hypothetical protein